MAGPQPDRFEKERLKKLERIEALGHDPWGGRFDDHLPIAEARRLAPDQAGVSGEHVRVAGRIMLRRKAGKLRFYDIHDYTGKVQLLFSRGDMSDEQWELMGQLDLGDLIGVDGFMRRTDTGEVSVFVGRLHVLCKSLAQPPEKWHGLEDVESRLRQRYLDLIYTEGVRDRMLRRTRIIDSVRKTLNDRRFFEVETPVLHAIAGGAAARPFTTHHNALDIDLYLRIALELHLKRLMVGGIERVYEIGRVFRNEGIDATHNPEFTMLEIYQAYGDYNTMMDLTEAIVVGAVIEVRNAESSRNAECGVRNVELENTAPSEHSALRTPSAALSSTPHTALRTPHSDRLTLPWGDGEIDFTPPWPRYRYQDLFIKYSHVPVDDDDAVREVARRLSKTGAIKREFIERMESGDIHPDIIVSEVFEATVEEHLTNPTFVIDYPASLCPLTKRKRGYPDVAERFELYIQGMEVANAYTELNDPRLQEELFRTQLAGLPEEDSMAKMDHDFIRALKVGMPPAGGLGIGIDRLVMLLTNSRSIRDVIFFPLLRPEQTTDH